MSLPTQPTQLAVKIAQYITRECHGKPEYSVSYAEIEQRAASHGIEAVPLAHAMQVLHKSTAIKVTQAGGDLYYRPAPAKKESGVATHLTWVRDNYPEMDSSNDASHEAFSELDFSWMFLPPEEIEEYMSARHNDIRV